MPLPLLTEHLRLQYRVEHLSVQQFITQPPVERLDVAVLPWAAWLDIQGLDPDPLEPSPERLCRELRPVVRAYVLGRAAQDEELGEPRQEPL